MIYYNYRVSVSAFYKLFMLKIPLYVKICVEFVHVYNIHVQCPFSRIFFWLLIGKDCHCSL